MSSRSRGRGKARVKRREVESEDGWTVITHGISKMSVNTSKGKGSRKNSDKADQPAHTLPSIIVEGLTLEKLLSDLQKLEEQWTDTSVGLQVAKLLEQNQHRKLTEAVCIGIGSFSRDWQHRHRSMWQLVLFVDIVKRLDKNEPHVKLYAQDPAFTTLDTSFLKHLNINVTDCGIEDHISPSSFVFSPFVDWFILLPMFLKGKNPELYAGNEILNDYSSYAGNEEKRGKLTECNEIGKMFLRGRDRTRLNDFERHAHALNGMVVYIRDSRDDTENSPI